MTTPYSQNTTKLNEISPIVADIPLQDMVEFADNPEPRCPCVLILDNSGSMRGRPIRARSTRECKYSGENCEMTLLRLCVSRW